MSAMMETQDENGYKTERALAGLHSRPAQAWAEPRSLRGLIRPLSALLIRPLRDLIRPVRAFLGP